MRRCFVLILIVFLTAGLLAAQGPVKNIPVGVQTATCADPAAELKATTSLIRDTGIINLQGKVCNRGNDYASRIELDARYMVYNAYPPVTFAQAGDARVISNTGLGTTLKKGECKDVNLVYRVPNVVAWGTPTSAPPATQRDVIKKIELCVLKDKSLATMFNKQENCSADNDCAEVNLPYREKR